MQLPDIDSVTDTLCVTAAEEILPRFRRLGRGDVRQKGPGDPVTVVDEAAEARLTEALTGLLPGSVVVAEESAARDPSVLDRLNGGAPVWIIDPLDGTNNFTQGRARFVVIVALAQGGRTLAAWIHDPINSVTATAVAGQGAPSWKASMRAGKTRASGSAAANSVAQERSLVASIRPITASAGCPEWDSASSAAARSRGPSTGWAA